MEEIYQQAIWTTKNDRALDWDAGFNKISTLVATEIGDAENFPKKIYHLDDEGEYLAAVKRQLLEDLNYFKSLWLDPAVLNASDCVIDVYGPVTVLSTYITDSDQDNHDWTILNRLPVWVFEAVGFYC